MEDHYWFREPVAGPINDPLNFLLAQEGEEIEGAGDTRLSLREQEALRTYMYERESWAEQGVGEEVIAKVLDARVKRAVVIFRRQLLAKQVNWDHVLRVMERMGVSVEEITELMLESEEV
jgi:hypothetical protein